MAKVIIAVHGLANKPPVNLLKDWWYKAIAEGLEDHLGYEMPKVKFEMVYWADILSKRPLDPLVTDVQNPYFLHEPYLPKSENFKYSESKTSGLLRDLVKKQFEKLFLNKDFSINYSFITDAFIHRYFVDLDTYYLKECPNKTDFKCKAKELIRERFVAYFKQYRGDEILLLTHSMGSIIALDVLNILMPRLKVDTLITFGSPLGNPIIRSKMAHELKKGKAKNRFKKVKHLKTPSNIQRNWFNFSDLDDTVAIYYKLADKYKANFRGVKVMDFLVQNDYEIQGEKNPHKSFGYLRTLEMSYAIHDFLVRKKANLFQRILKNISQKMNRRSSGL